MATMDFARLRNQAMNDGQDSEVTVNTRALIDKVLARYSSEHTTLRELIQNASDAGASTVVIKYETDPSLNVPAPQSSDESVLLKHVIQHHTLRRLTVSNNGQPFSNADWSRLKSIADGNPDETKIGAFGVGFYSVFADCDEPFVVSGNKMMAFYWKGNTLSTKVAVLSPEQSSSDTTFSLKYRQANPSSPSYNPSKAPNLPSLCQFLSTSLTFVGLSSIELHLDGHKIASFGKKTSPPSDIQIPAGLNPKTEGGLMTVSRVSRQSSQIDSVWSNVIATAQNPARRVVDAVPAEIKNAGSSLKSFFSKLSGNAQTNSRAARPLIPVEKPVTFGEDISGESRAVIFLQVCTVEADTHVTRGFSAEIERATKKPPPKKTKVALLTSPFQEISESLSTASGTTSGLSAKIFADILPTNAGRIFIGFPTAQTTGILAHVSAPSLIPTVERESIDLNARYISNWNYELLRVAGLAARISYVLDISEIKAKTASDGTGVPSLIPKAAYVLQQYSSSLSAPSGLVGQTIEDAFWSCSKERSIDILSSKGVLPSKSVRMPAETLSFLGEVPMVPQELATGAMAFMLSLHNRGFISDLTMEDIRKGLEARALTDTELMEFLKWCSSKLDSGELDPPSVRNLFAVTIAALQDNSTDAGSGTILQLSTVESYVNSSRINPTLPIPSWTMPFKFTNSIPVKQLQMFGWQELSIVGWLRFMTSGNNLANLLASESLATQTLTLISKGWDQIDVSSKEAVRNILAPHPVLPTKMGMRRPEEAYFTTVKLFDDLPTVKPFPGVKDKFLLALGVRKTIELSVVFERMKAPQGGQDAKISWSHMELIRYFASVLQEIPQQDLERLRETAFLPGIGSASKPDQLFKARDLYAPAPSIGALGLTQIKLPQELQSQPREKKFLLALGLMEYPSALTIIKIMEGAGRTNNRHLYDLSLVYFLQNYFVNGYEKDKAKISTLKIPFLPTEQVDFPTLVAPFQCYSNEAADCFGYAIIRADISPHADKLGLQRDPPIRDVVQKLLSQPVKSKIEAEVKFSYIATRLGDLDFTKPMLTSLSSAKIVPIFRKYHSAGGFDGLKEKQSGISEMRIHHYVSPNSVFLGMDQEYRDLIEYVQYGPEATTFLLKAGAKHEPSISELARLLAENPPKFLSTMGHEKYLGLLRKLAEQASQLWKDKSLADTLRKSKILLGYKDIKTETKKEYADDDNYEDDDVAGLREWLLVSGNEVTIIDEVHWYSKFRDYLIAAPQEEVLETFYEKFGAKKISDQVKEEPRIGNPLRDQKSALKLQEAIFERSRLFLHEYERDASSHVVRHDAKWLTSNLKVELVSDISIRVSLLDHNVAYSQRRTAFIRRSGRHQRILSIVQKYDHYDVSSQLIPLLIKRPKQNDVIALEQILTEPLRRLQQKGINVERILRKQEYEARIAQQQELKRQGEENARRAEELKRNPIQEQPANGHVKEQPYEEPSRNELESPDPAPTMPGAFGSPEQPQPSAPLNRNQPAHKNLFNKFAKTLGFEQDKRLSSTNPPQISKDLQATKKNIQNAISECRPAGRDVIDSKHHADATELDKGGYCNDEQAENIAKAYTVPIDGISIDVYFGKFQLEKPRDIEEPISAFLPLILSLTKIFGVDPSAINIFLDSKSNTVAFNLSGSLFFNLAWFMELHWSEWGTEAGKNRAWDAWYLTYCHELAHNLVKDHNARHQWYQQQIAVEFARGFRTRLGAYLGGEKTQASLLD
ncbi:hypothetical protein BU16DRAFT_124365 [Lophium mytilinum]|uniref:Sacsin/Nov domain-containing protein n=1 Tax=Lophium mytilinum TaxID=390894 RepID=A0A6A6QHR7_9PEZI|nr:hypothetical protein BU16DRAFT_124365 [Lophium mytilinum]